MHKVVYKLVKYLAAQTTAAQTQLHKQQSVCLSSLCSTQCSVGSTDGSLHAGRPFDLLIDKPVVDCSIDAFSGEVHITQVLQVSPLCHGLRRCFCGDRP